MAKSTQTLIYIFTLSLFYLFTLPVIFAQSIEFTYSPEGNRVEKMVIYLKDAVVDEPSFVETSAGIDQTDNKSGNVEKIEHPDFTIYPNPFKSEITVDPAKTGQIYTVRAVSVTGEVLYEEESISGATVVSFSSREAGVYFLQIECLGKVVTWKVVKE